MPQSGLPARVGTLLAALFAGLAVDRPAAAQGSAAPTPASPTAPASAQAAVTRADLALAYLAFDRAWTGHRPTGSQVATTSQAFDQATLAFFAGRNADAVRAIHRVTQQLLAPGDSAAVSPLAVRATVEPHVYRRGGFQAPVLKVVPLYARGSETALTEPALLVRVTVLSDAGRTIASQLVPVPPDAPPGVAIELPLADRPAEVPRGRYRVTVTLVHTRSAPTPGAPTGDAASEWFVTDDDPDAHREELLRKVGTLDTTASAELLDGIATFKARARLLTSRPSPLNTAQWRANPITLARELDLELSTLLSGADPYVRRAGHLWRVVRGPARNVPVRTYVPVAMARSGAQAPLLIAIHGVGGDENMFPDALGEGRITQLADSGGFIVASPNGDQFTTPEDFDRLVETVAAVANVDRTRIWIVGHSRGAGQALALARTRVEQVAAVVCIAGFGRVPPDGAIAPVRVVLGEVDPLAAPARLRPLVAEATAAGRTVELEVMPALGHTTVVSEALPGAIAWLRSRTLPPAAPGRR
ncbi:MAG: hypothetical protein HY275_10670 [Gemmatimonadetes bacterium]|nr:hypothetical protein [Gemmatimonadota bacterium]